MALSYSFSTAVMDRAKASLEPSKRPLTNHSPHHLSSNMGIEGSQLLELHPSLPKQLFYVFFNKVNDIAVGVPGVNTAATPAFFKPGISASGITPPPITRTSPMPFFFQKFNNFREQCIVSTGKKR